MHINIEIIRRYLEKNPLMSLAPSNHDNFIIKGQLALNIVDGPYGNVQDEFLIKIVIPKSFPKEIPTIYELEGRFPKTIDYHVFEDDFSLCLGSPMSLMKRINEDPTLDGYIHNCVVPYFYAIALKQQGRKEFVFGELYHGLLGILQDYIEVFELQNIKQVIQLLSILSQKANKGNKMICPCGCSRIVSRCSMHKKILEYRDVLPRNEYAKNKDLFTDIFEEWKKSQARNKVKKLIPYV
jgi:hypothetical protein